MIHPPWSHIKTHRTHDRSTSSITGGLQIWIFVQILDLKPEVSLKTISIKTTHLEVGGAELNPVPLLLDRTDNHYEYGGGDDDEQEGHVQRRHNRRNSPEDGAEAESGEQDAAAAVQERKEHSGTDDSRNPDEQRAVEYHGVHVGPVLVFCVEVTGQGRGEVGGARLSSVCEILQ